jgi:hypothetical protein
MAVRVQVVLSEQERERFRRLARLEGMSMSAWLKKAGLERAKALVLSEPLRTREELSEFFSRCDQREQGREPDWEEHLEVLRRSRVSGLDGGR